eukprot:jgi/Mesen1/1685/ME000137S00594
MKPSSEGSSEKALWNRLLRSPTGKKVLKTINKIRLTLLCLFITFLVWRETLGAGKLGTPEQDMDLFKRQLLVLHERTALLTADTFLQFRKAVDMEVPHNDPPMPYKFVPVVKDWDEQREAYKAGHPGCNVSRTTGQPSIMMLTGSSPKVCETSMGDRLLLQALKNKIDYCRPRGIEIFHNMAALDAELTGFWSKLPLLRLAMLKHPHVEWFCADMAFDIPMASYEKFNMVMGGYDCQVYEDKNWVGLNTGSVFIRNNQWTLDLLDMWAVFGPIGRVRNEAGELFTRELLGRPAFEADDQSALVYLLTKHSDTLRERVFLEAAYDLHGYWQSHVDKFEDMMAHNSPGLIPHGNDKCPFTTHFVGCKPCGDFGGQNGHRCFREMIRAFNFADNQILRPIGLQHVNLTSWQVKPRPAITEDSTGGLR